MIDTIDEKAESCLSASTNPIQECLLRDGCLHLDGSVRKIVTRPILSEKNLNDLFY